MDQTVTSVVPPCRSTSQREEVQRNGSYSMITGCSVASCMWSWTSLKFSSTQFFLQFLRPELTYSGFNCYKKRKANEENWKAIWRVIDRRTIYKNALNNICCCMQPSFEGSRGPKPSSLTISTVASPQLKIFTGLAISSIDRLDLFSRHYLPRTSAHTGAGVLWACATWVNYHCLFRFNAFSENWPLEPSTLRLTF